MWLQHQKELSMVSVEEHYENLLADVYTWLMGGFDNAKEKNSGFFRSKNIKPLSSKVAIDLGAGSGFQSIPLAELGYSVLSIDLSQKLLSELKNNSRNLSITTINDDILNFPQYIKCKCELVVCMTDTITHLKSKEDASAIFQKAFDSLENNGKLILTFRDLSEELLDT